MIAPTPKSLLLLHLPDEVLITIFSFLDFRTLCDAILVCKHFDDLAEPFLYHTVQVLSGRQAEALSAGLHANARRATWIRSLLVSTKFGEDPGLGTLPPHIGRMRNLQHLCLETPDCNAKFPEERVVWVNLQDRYERIFESASAVVPRADERALPNLKTCTLHFVDGQKELYSMTKYAMLFLHPKLRSLTMSCASTDFPDRLLTAFQDDETLAKSTNLEYLHLEECDIFSPSLAVLLSFPRALKSLKISEGIRYDGIFNARNTRMHGNVSPGPFVDAIAQHCSDSLEFLSLSLGYLRQGFQHINQPSQHLNLTGFRAIKQLDLDVRTVNLVRVRAGCDHATWRRLPPNLETLKVFGIPLGDRPPFQARRRVWFPFEICIATDKAKHGVRLLKNLIYSYEYYREDDEIPRLSISDDGDTVEGISEVLIAHRRMTEKCRELQPTLKKAGVRLEIEMVALPNGFIPPYLFQEDKPKYFTLWESTPRSA
ncbi:uncharacterized protein Z518_01834 [Rhinocladiella mackenziei CBS 650.93]|uniref:F-box domain-containing protein n=1 Tax=Rhinocladiella mackenziei CBS 650.93 TaxID=1442369 RepID=A0A0D2IVF8_9EURO|nr:uncharacterized protein Z518_01834 [Rhinocladiella mackenziei CBS 650.93]KIX07181.1 hypothetical protein Z518_01834 [Rhinocladiella mackenziei CBS 650.93]